MKKSIKVFLISLLFVFVFSSWTLAKNDKAKANPNANKDKQEKIEKIRDFEKPTPGKSNAVIYREKTDQVSAGLLEVAENEKNKGQQKKEEVMEKKQINNPGTGEQVNERKKTGEELGKELRALAEESEENQDETADAIDKIENQGGFKKLLVGTDYKNLGQLRSSLAHNENQVRQLTRISGELEDGEEKEALETQLMILMQERERIKEVIKENESGFSFLGWVFRLMNGYPKDSIDETTETELENEVAEVLSDDTENTEAEMTNEEKAQQDAENNPQMPPVLDAEIIQQ